MVELTKNCDALRLFLFLPIFCSVSYKKNASLQQESGIVILKPRQCFYVDVVKGGRGLVCAAVMRSCGSDVCLSVCLSVGLSLKVEFGATSHLPVVSAAPPRRLCPESIFHRSRKQLPAAFDGNMRPRRSSTN